MWKVYIKKSRKIITRLTSYKALQDWLEAYATKEPAGYTVEDVLIDFVWKE